MYCTNCGTEIPQQVNFCAHCGEPARPATPTKNRAGLAWVWLIGLFVGVVVLLIFASGDRPSETQRDRYLRSYYRIPAEVDAGSPYWVLAIEKGKHEEMVEALKIARRKKDFEKGVEIIRSRAAELRHALGQVESNRHWSEVDKQNVVHALSQELAFVEQGADAIENPP
jgi:predicted nucleic acid-binding Zn ribbon protein